MPLSTEDQFAINDLLSRLNFAIDDRDADEWVACFTPEGSFENPESVWAGEDAHRKLVADQIGLPRCQHIMTNLLLEGDGDRATGRANGAVFEEIDGVYSISNFSGQEHHFVKVDGKWLIERTIRHRPKKKNA